MWCFLKLSCNILFVGIDGIICDAVTLDNNFKPQCRDRSHFEIINARAIFRKKIRYMLLFFFFCFFFVFLGGGGGGGRSCHGSTCK